MHSTPQISYEDQEIIVLKQVFNKYDTDRDGYLGLDEFVKLVNALTLKLSEDIVGKNKNGTKKLIDPLIILAAHKYYDLDGKGTLTFAEVYKWWSSNNKFYLLVGEPARLLYKAYQLFCGYAQGKGGQMTFDNFELLLEHKNIGHQDNTFDRIDINEDGLVNFHEFFNWLKWV